LKRLVITADDFGVHQAVNEAVQLGHDEGVLTAASLMVGAPAADDAIERARRSPSLAVGLHLVLVEGRPVLPATEVPDLVDQCGCFRADMVAAGAAMFLRPAARRQLENEITAQFQAFADTGLRLDHVNAHKHFHLHPTIAGLILKIGPRFGMTAARFPIEPRSILNRVEPTSSAAVDPVVDLWASLARSRFRRAGILVPDQVFGLRWSGSMSRKRLAALLHHLPHGLTEIYLHPATRGGFEGAAPGYGYDSELDALMAPEVIRAASDPTIVRAGFEGFAARGRSTRETVNG